MHNWRHFVVGITWVVAFPVAALAQSPFVFFIAQLNELDPLIAEAERHSDGERQATRYRCLRHDLTLIETGLSAYTRGENTPPAPLIPLCGDYRGLESNPVIISTAQERTALAYLTEEIRALIAGVAALERYGTIGRRRFGGDVLRHDLRMLETGLNRVIQAAPVAPRGFVPRLGGRR
jgi:RAQPRD family integrative conjugative element protein